MDVYLLLRGILHSSTSHCLQVQRYLSKTCTYEVKRSNCFILFENLKSVTIVHPHSSSVEFL